ncbi:MAG: phosphoribosyltransferase family protein [Patescibacteria group bacterium]|nr:phosphoribosyltransferase family protein [Patescibacteria group bacterium]
MKLHEKNPTAPLSPIYLNIRELPEWLYALAGDILHDLVVQERITDFDYVIGIPNAGEPIGKAFAKAVSKPHLRIQKVENEEGRHITSTILDPFEKGKKVVLIDDLITKADTKREAIKSVEANGLEVVATLVLYDREQGGLIELNKDRMVIAVAKLSETLEFFVGKKKITSETRDEVMKYIIA